jgi:hypothetical protein
MPITVHGSAIEKFSEKQGCVMTGEKKIDKRKRRTDEHAGALGTYNPVNMAGKPAQPVKGLPKNEELHNDDYNPVNMAGKKAESINEAGAPQPVDGKTTEH